MTKAEATWRRARRRAGALKRRAHGLWGAAARSPDGGDESGAEFETLVAESPLFDHEWYSMILDRSFDRRAAVGHFLGKGRDPTLTPHPLVVPEVLRASLGERVGDDDDPFVVYLSARAWEAQVHPLFDLASYVDQHPEALTHPWGPVGHYQDVGALAGALVNDWYVPGPDDPRGLIDWLWRDAANWAERRKLARPTWRRAGPSGGVADASYASPDPDGVSTKLGTVTIVLVVELDDHDLLDASLTSLLAQTEADWELLVLFLEHGPDAAAIAPHLPDDPRIRVEPGAFESRWQARNHATERALGTHLAWLTLGDVWLPGRLRSVRAGLREPGVAWVQDCARDERPGVVRRHASLPVTLERLLAGATVELSVLVCSRELVRGLGGFDESLPSGQLLDFALRLCRREPGRQVPRLGVTFERSWRRQTPRLPANHRPFLDLESLVSAADPVLHDALIDWPSLQGESGAADVVSVVVLTHHDWEMTRTAVESVLDDDDSVAVGELEVVVVDNGAPVVTSAVLAAMARQHPQVTLVRSPVNRGFSLGNNLALPHTRGATLVFLNNDTEVQPGWLAPLVAELEDPQVLGVQSLLLYPSGVVQSAGVVFPQGGGIPHELLKGFPAEDADGIDRLSLHALTGAALAMRRTDFAELRGFDPLFRNGMEDIDLCLRLSERRPGRFVARPDSRVIHHESQSPGRFASSLANRRLLVSRWSGRFPEDDVQAWGELGFEVMNHRVTGAGGVDKRLRTAEPVLRRRARLEVREGVPRLRWALKNPAPYAAEAERWGDTHVVRQLGDALRHLGQEVVIDHRPGFDRDSGAHDDVVLLLRGVAPYSPLLDRVNLMWLISHPDMYERDEHLGWDRIYVASHLFAERLAFRGVPAVPLLQATDPSFFHPDLAEPDTGERVLFVGNSRRQPRPMARWAVERGLPLAVYGQDWEEFLPGEVVRGAYLPNAKLGAAYRSAGVVLNDHWHDMAEHGFVSNRLFDAVAAGARVVSDPVPGLSEALGDAVVVARDAHHLERIAMSSDLSSLFGSDEQRRAHAASVAREHSFTARAAVLIDDALRIRAARGLD